MEGHRGAGKKRVGYEYPIKHFEFQISDDEDDTHPNIDTGSLFRWRHQARVERMDEMEKEKSSFEAKKTDTTQKLREVREKLKKAELEKASSSNIDELKKSLKTLQIESDRIKAEEAELRKKEKKTPWNVDTICKDGVSKTVINKPQPRENLDGLPEEERERLSKEFIKKYEKDIKKFGMLRKYEDSKQFLTENFHLVSEHTSNYLVIWCINLELEDKHELMGHVAHQCICMQYIFELASKLDVDPRSTVSSFFARLPQADAEYKAQFDNEVQQFRERIKKRAQEKVAEAMAEAEEEERQQRLGPGGLDPVEVFETLPEILQKCFESRNIKLLQETIMTLPEEEARYHMKRCVDSGLWLPEGGKESAADEEADDDAAAGDTEKVEEEKKSDAK